MDRAYPSPTSPKQQAAKALVSSPSRGEEGSTTRKQPGYTQETLKRAKRLRREMTPEEKLLWGKLRDRRLGGHKFRSQQPIGPYIADFVCQEQLLIIEADGSQHGDSKSDARRDAFLISKGYCVLRFWNNEITCNLIGVLEAVLAALDTPHPSAALRLPPSPARGEGFLDGDSLV
jgi:very-short-patch-repair endonuclease